MPPGSRAMISRISTTPHRRAGVGVLVHCLCIGDLCCSRPLDEQASQGPPAVIPGACPPGDRRPVACLSRSVNPVPSLLVICALGGFDGCLLLPAQVGDQSQQRCQHQERSGAFVMGISGRQWLRGWVHQEDLARAVDDKWMGNARNGVIHGSYHADSRERTGHDEDDPFHFALCSSFSLNTNASRRRPVACPVPPLGRPTHQRPCPPFPRAIPLTPFPSPPPP